VTLLVVTLLVLTLLVLTSLVLTPLVLTPLGLLVLFPFVGIPATVRCLGSERFRPPVHLIGQIPDPAAHGGDRRLLTGFGQPSPNAVHQFLHLGHFKELAEQNLRVAQFLAGCHAGDGQGPSALAQAPQYVADAHRRGKLGVVHDVSSVVVGRSLVTHRAVSAKREAGARSISCAGSRVARSVLHSVLGLLASLGGVTLDLLRLALRDEALVAGGLASGFLDLALGRLRRVLDFLLG
jgi:hypothetical protein